MKAPVPKPQVRRPSAPWFDSLEQEAYLNLWRTYDRLRALEEELFGRFQLSAQQYNTLRLLQAAYPLALPTLSLGARLVSRAPDMTRMLDKLEERGFVARERRPENRRVVAVLIAPAGTALLKELAPLVRECHKRQLGHLRTADLRNLIASLQAARRPHEDPENQWRGNLSPLLPAATLRPRPRKRVSRNGHTES